MKRAVITGMGVVSPLGNNIPETLTSLRETKSGIKFQDAYKEMGLQDPEVSEDDIIAAILKHPILMERPIVVTNGRAKLGRPPEAVLEIL